MHLQCCSSCFKLNEDTISDTQNFSQQISTLLLLEEDEESVSCVLEFLFTNISVKEMIDHVIYQFMWIKS